MKVFAGRGIKIHGLYYWCDSFRDPAIDQTTVLVRYDPWDAGTAYAYVQNHWVRCYSQYFVAFQGRSQRELMIAAAELRRRQSLHSKASTVSARKLATFLKSVECEEVLLSQRLMDNETRRANTLPPSATDSPRLEEKTRDYSLGPAQVPSWAEGSPDPSNALDVLETY